jgi:epoxyqueuosine reductase
VCLWNVKFARALPAGSPYAARGFIGGKDARTLAEEILTMDEDVYRVAFRGSAMKRAKLAGLQRNAGVVLERPRRRDDRQVE